MKFLVFAASHRPESYNRKLAAHAADYVSKKSVEVDFAEYEQLDMPLYNDTFETPSSVHAFAQRAAKADALIISSPEYNWSYPASIKNIIDWTSRLNPSPIKGKAVFLMSATPGARGGILGISHLKTPFDALQTHVFNKVFPLGNCTQSFDSNNGLIQKQSDLLHPMLDDFVTFAKKLSNP